MEETKIDLFPIKNLWDQYKVGKTTFYTRALADLRIEPKTIGNRSYITGEEKALLDKYYSLLESDRNAWLDELFGRMESTETAIAPISREVREIAILAEFAKVLQPQRGRIENFKDLAYLADNEEIIPSSLVKELTGTRPKGTQCEWGRFEFIRAGRMGRETGWIVKQRTRNNG